jgi:hypothetical protein
VVPHKKALRAIALASYCSTNTTATVDRLCKQHGIRFPVTFEQFWKNEILMWLPPELEALFLTTDASLTSDYRPMFLAAKHLGVDKYLAITGEGPTFLVPEPLLEWRSHKTIRVALETMLLCKMPITQISSDFRQMYQITFDEKDLAVFSDLYVDVEYSAGENWILYEECIGEDEARFKSKLMRQPKDYVRHQLGVPVSLNSDQVLNRLISDSYFTCMELKAETENHPSRDQIARIKLERDTIFKAMDRVSKLKEAASGTNENAAASEIKKIILEYSDQEFLTKDELLGQ